MRTEYILKFTLTWDHSLIQSEIFAGRGPEFVDYKIVKTKSRFLKLHLRRINISFETN